MSSKRARNLKLLPTDSIHGTDSRAWLSHHGEALAHETQGIMSLHPCWVRREQVPYSASTNKLKGAVQGTAHLLTTKMAPVSGLSLC